MSFAMPDLIPVMPEIAVLAMACVVLLADLFLKDEQRNVSYYLAQLTLLIGLLLTLNLANEGSRLSFGDSVINDQMATLLKSFIFIVTAIGFVYSRRYLKERGIFKGEYYVLGLFGVLGMMVMVSSYSFLTLYLGLELLSLSQYALVAFNRDSSRASEAAMKYFVLGAIASGMLLYGMSILYGMSGSLDIIEVSNYLIRELDNDVALIFGLSFVIVGLAFKLGAVPFHMWLPDVYQGAPTSVTLYVGTAPKIAAFAIVMRLLVEGLGHLHGDWQGMLIILAVLSLTVGNFIAIAQTNIKRMLAYSTISHVGFLLLGILAGTSQGYAASMFYAIVYALTAAGAFGMILLLANKDFEAEELDDFKGLGERHPWFAFLMLLLMFSMAGVPLTVGFYAKLSVLSAVVRVELYWLAIYAVLMSVVGAYYYLRVIKLMYFDKPLTNQPISQQWDMNLVLSINGLLMLVLFFLPGGLMSLCIKAINF